MSNEACDSILVVLSNMELGEQQNESPPQNMLPPIAAPALAEPPQNQQMQDPHSTLYNWQATKVNVNDRIAYLFNNEVLSDVHFIVGRAPNQQRIPAHRFILSAGSAVFDAMFNGTLATGAKEEHLPDVEPSAFLSLLRFLYSDVVNICPDTVMTTLYTAKKYAVPSLEKHCVDFLKTNLGSYNAFLLLTQARLFDEPQLAALCFEMIDKNTVDALAADGFTDIDMETLICILQRDSLRVSEIKLFEATVRWAKAECLRRQRPPTPLAMREVLGGALKLLRFPLMNVEEFAAEPARSGLLTDAEVVAMFLYYHVNPKPSAGFPETPRCCMVGKEQTVKRFMRIESRWGYSGTSDCIRFSADVDVFVVGFGLYGSIHGPADYEVDLQIIQANTERIKAKHKTIFSCDGSDKAFRVMFKEPVEVLANVLYIASATLKGPDSHYGTKGMRKVVVDLPNEGVKTLHWNNMRETSVQSSGNNKVTFNFSYASGQNNGTSVEDGQIPEIIFYT